MKETVKTFRRKEYDVLFGAVWRLSTALAVIERDLIEPFIEKNIEQPGACSKEDALDLLKEIESITSHYDLSYEEFASILKLDCANESI